MKYLVTSIIIGDAEAPSKLKMDALKDIKEAEESSGGEANDITIDDIVLHRIVVKYNKKTRIEIWEAIDNERLHKKKFESPEDMHLYLNQMLMRVGNDIIVN